MRVRFRCRFQPGRTRRPRSDTWLRSTRSRPTRALTTASTTISRPCRRRFPAVTASGSGLDPQISVANARLQAARVAEVNDLSVKEVDDLIGDHTQGRSLGFLGEPGVNVLELNLALDKEAPAR